MRKISTLFVLILLQLTFSLYGQGHFDKEIADLTANDQSINKENIVLFTGSSTIRMWKSLQTDFPKYNIVNRGFGGSQTSDLLYYFDKLILPYDARKIFIYEGDNDLFVGKSPKQVLSTMDSVITLIRQKVSPSVPVYVISPKPSTSRWHLKDKYLELHKLLQELASSKKEVYFVDVWSPALDPQGNVVKDIFLQDGLHMNSKGYEIWIKVIKKYLP